MEELDLQDAFKKERPLSSKVLVGVVIGIALAVILGFVLLAVLLPQESSTPVFSRVMSKNYSLRFADIGETTDWLELYNPTEAAFDLSGYGLTNNRKKPFLYTFPQGTVLEAGARLTIYCFTGLGVLENEPYCAAFHIDADGDTLFLVSPTTAICDTVTVPAMEADQVYLRTTTADGCQGAVHYIVTDYAASEEAIAAE